MYVPYEKGSYPDGWHRRLRDAHLATMAALGLGAGLAPDGFLAARGGRTTARRSFRTRITQQG
ncbi:hypothetical protein ACIQ1J_22040 [Streptomyces sp. NPDC097107]|uniref:hypothetical protein n=1 Tax=Streptomyces sp. NPDC097107 TaxID=3366089 RepID=UPI0037FB2D45